jgi:radical SAM protein with 4Fe4S-binding SPASM domain
MKTLQALLDSYAQQYNTTVVNLDPWYDQDIISQSTWLKNIISSLHKDVFENNEKIIFTVTKRNTLTDVLMPELQFYLNQIDISNYFVAVLTNSRDHIADLIQASTSNHDPIPVSYDLFDNIEVEIVTSNVNFDTRKDYGYSYNSKIPLGLDATKINNTHRRYLFENKTFCMYPWIHLHVFPTGTAMPCCHAEHIGNNSLGNAQQTSLKDLWNSDRMKQLRKNMLSDTADPFCKRCYEQEKSGFFSGRNSANKHFGKHIARVDSTHDDGTVDDFEMIYWDIRYSNLCNLRCRSCGHIFSSSWYQDQVKLAGKDWAQKNKVLNYAGKTETDMWEQLIPHLDYVEQIYFAGGEPLLMEEHYKILEELERRGRFDVRLIYNTNFTEVKLKDRWVFDYWKKFDSVAVGASLDAMGPRAEYVRKGTLWDQVERNREKMLEICPEVDFYISPTFSILNAWHVPDFHKNWVDKGLIKPSDLNVNILQDPDYYRIDIAPLSFKEKIKQKYQEHLEWLRPLDQLQRATVGFESAIKFMMAIDNTALITKFWKRTEELDQLRKENLLDVAPELEQLR